MNDVLLTTTTTTTTNPPPSTPHKSPKKVEREQHASMQITQPKQPVQCQFDRNSKNAQQVSRR